MRVAVGIVIVILSVAGVLLILRLAANLMGAP